ncbi:MAG: hypothetical protein U0175_02530 [Caldilineaceae bacterium]
MSKFVSYTVTILLGAIVIGGIIFSVKTLSYGGRLNQSSAITQQIATLPTTPAEQDKPTLDAYPVPILTPFETLTPAPTLAPTPTSKPYASLAIKAVETVKNGPYLDMLWSPDGKQFLASKQASTYKLLDRASQKSNNGSLAEMQDIVSGVNDLWLVDIGNEKEQKILDRVSTYAWSLDGKKLVYIQPVNDEGFGGAIPSPISGRKKDKEIGLTW